MSRKASSTVSSPIKRDGRGRERAERVIRFIENLTVPSGAGHGKLFVLDDFQKDFIRDIYEPHRNDKRVVRRAILSMGRKNGKTALIACIALAHLVGPEATINGEIYSAANDRDQAAIIFKFAKQIVEREPDLRAQIEVIPSTKTMVARRTGSVYRAVSSEATTKHGLLPTLVIYDELAQAKNRALYDVLDTAFGACDEPLFIVISTQSNDPEHVLSILIDDGLSHADPSIVCHLYAADEDCALDDEVQWRKANPALGKFRSYDDLAIAVAKAKRMPAEEPKVRNLFLNQRVSPVSTLISRAEWMACAGSASLLPGEDVYLALDLSSVADLTALVAGSMQSPCRCEAFFWKPQEYLAEHSARDFGSGSRRYQDWAASGHLIATPGRSIDPEAVARFVGELSQRFNVLGLAYDRWRMQDVMREFDRIGLKVYVDGDHDVNGFQIKGNAERNMRSQRPPSSGDGLRLVPWGQGFRDMAPAIDALELAVIERKLVHPNNPVLNWNIANAVARMDPSGNRKLDKEAVRFRIDGAVALAMMMGLRAREGEPKKIDIDALIG